MSKIKIGFTGDVAFSDYTKDIYKNPKRLDKKIYDFLNDNDYNVINFESPTTDYLKITKVALSHRSDLGSVKFIKDNIKNPILSLANNHMMDFGIKGLSDTIKNVEDNQMMYIGAGRNENEATKYIILGDEVKVGIMSFQYKDVNIASKDGYGTAHDKHKNLIKRKIKELREKVDWVVVVYHGGEEFVNVPLPYDRDKYKKFLDWGIDVLVCHHPHTVQGYEKIGNKMIFYSLGNFIFDTNYQRAQLGTEFGELLSITFSKSSYEFNNLNLFNNRCEEKLEVVDECEHFRDITKDYKKNWMEEYLRLSDIRKRRRVLRNFRNRFSIDGLYIEKIECNNYMTFDELVKKHEFDGIDKDLKIDGVRAKVVKKAGKINNRVRNANYKRKFYGYYVKLCKKLGKI